MFALTKTYILILLLLIGFPVEVCSHPHVFIENSVSIIFDSSGMTGIKVKWVFDEMFSSTMIEGYDSNKNGVFSPGEYEKLRKGAFVNLKNYHYFTHITIGKKVFEVTYVKDFQAVIKGHKILYTFFIPCHVKAGPVPKKVNIAMYDETYYTDMLLDGYQCDHTAAPGIVSSNLTIIENHKKSFYFGQIAPVEIILTFKK